MDALERRRLSISSACSTMTDLSHDSCSGAIEGERQPASSDCFESARPPGALEGLTNPAEASRGMLHEWLDSTTATLPGHSPQAARGAQASAKTAPFKPLKARKPRRRQRKKGQKGGPLAMAEKAAGEEDGAPAVEGKPPGKRHAWYRMQIKKALQEQGFTKKTRIAAKLCRRALENAIIVPCELSELRTSRMVEHEDRDYTDEELAEMGVELIEWNGR